MMRFVENITDFAPRLPTLDAVAVWKAFDPMTVAVAERLMRRSYTLVRVIAEARALRR